MDSDDFSEFMTDASSADTAFDGYTELGHRGHSRFGRLTRHGQIWFVKSYKLPDVAEAAMRLRKEFEILLKLNHRGVVRAGWLQDIPGAGLSLVMEYIDGESLDEFIGHATRAERRAIAADLVDTMAYVHSHGVCHLDLKPSNIMVTGHGETTHIKIIDFGMADTPGSAIFKAPGGTRSFGAPEQFKAGYTSTPRSDVYSMARLLMLMGVHTRAARRALREDPLKRPADARALGDLIGSMRLRRRFAAAITVAAATALILIFFPWPEKSARQGVVSTTATPAAPEAFTDDTPVPIPVVDAQQNTARPAAETPKAPSGPATPPDEYTLLVAQWNAELSRRADVMAEIARREDLTKEQRRQRLGQMQGSIVEDTRRIFLPYYNRMGAAAGSRPMSWCSIYEPAFGPVRERMADIYRTLDD